MSDYNIPSELVERVIKTLPDDWCLRIELFGWSTPPFVTLTDSNGETAGRTHQQDYETLAECIQRVLAEVPEDDEEN